MRDTKLETAEIWFNPACSKCRAGKAAIEAHGLDVNEVRYLDETPTRERIEEVRALLGVSLHELVRVKESAYAELDLSAESGDEQLLDAMVNRPELIERPIVILGDRAVIGRPTERVVELLSTVAGKL